MCEYQHLGGCQKKDHISHRRTVYKLRKNKLRFGCYLQCLQVVNNYSVVNNYFSSVFTRECVSNMPSFTANREMENINLDNLIIIRYYILGCIN